MEPITAGAIALITLLADKTLEKTGDKLLDKAFDTTWERVKKIVKLLKDKSPEVGTAIEKVERNPKLVQQQPEDYGEAILVEKVETVAENDPAIRQELEALAEAIKSQPQISQVIENWQGINIKEGNNTINNPTFNF